MKHTHAPQVYYSLAPKRRKQPQASATKEFYSRYSDLISLLSSLLLPAPGTPLEAMSREAVRGEISKRRGYLCGPAKPITEALRGNGTLTEGTAGA